MGAVIFAFPIGGSLIRAWTPDLIKAQIATTRDAIKAGLRAGDMERVSLLISAVVGMRICAGEIAVKLHPPRKWT